MKLFSEMMNNPPSTMYHITPSANVESILKDGLKIGVRRSTAGIETQKKIYLTSQYPVIENLFPNSKL